MNDDIYKNEGMAIFIKGKMILGVHPDNLINNLYNFSEGNMKIDWGVVSRIAGIDLANIPKNVLSGVININKTGKP